MICSCGTEALDPLVASRPVKLSDRLPMAFGNACVLMEQDLDTRYIRARLRKIQSEQNRR